MKRLILQMVPIALLAVGCSSQAQLALARTSVTQAHAAEARVDREKGTGPALELAKVTVSKADSLLQMGEKGEFGPLTVGERLNDTWMHGEVATAAFLLAGAEGETSDLKERLRRLTLQLEQEKGTLEDYSQFLNAIRGGEHE